MGIRRRAVATATRRVLDASFLAGSGTTGEDIAAPTRNRCCGGPECRTCRDREKKARRSRRSWPASAPDDGAEATEHQKPRAVESVIPGTSKEVRGFVENVNRISETEAVEHERINQDGVVIEQKHRKFNYVAEIQETRPGNFEHA
jgi:hypothetical protein